MHSKCNTHIKEIKDAFENTFNNLKNIIKLEYSFEVKDYIEPIEINHNSSVGDQIKHYRQLKGVQQKDVAKHIDIDRYTMYQIENKDYKQIYYPETIRKIIDYLEIEDKIIWNDPYLKFIVYDEYEKIKEFRLKADIPQKDFANLLDVEASTLRKWETGESKMSRKNFEKFNNLLLEQENSKKFKCDDSYINFIKNNPKKQFKDYIKKECINIEEFARRMDRHPTTILNMINGKTTITRKQYYKFEELLNNQKLGIISSDPYINFVKSNKQSKFILNFIKKNKMSRAELSRQLGIGRCTVERWIRNEIVISRSNYEKLMDFINSYEQKKESTNDTCSMH